MVYDVQIGKKGWICGVEALTRNSAAKKAARRVLGMTPSELELLFNQNPEDCTVEEVRESRESLRFVAIVGGNCENALLTILEEANITTEYGDEDVLLVRRDDYPLVQQLADEMGITFETQRIFAIEKEKTDSSQCKVTD